MKTRYLAVLALLAAGAHAQTATQLDQQADAMMRASFRERGTAQMATIKWPAEGQYIGDWKEGEKLAQNGRGMTWTDASAAPAKNGAMCYNCHQIDKKEISFGTIGPSLWNYGKLRGVTDPADPAAAAIIKYTWGKLYNSKAYAACSHMPRFGHAELLNEQQIRDVMALLLDPKSPVNQ